MLRLDVPLDPDQGQGQQWLRDELAKPEYGQAKPTPVDQAGRAIADWLQGLLHGTAGTPPLVGVLIVVGVILVIVLILFLVYGLPHRNRRSALAGALFGEDETRSAARLRADAEAAARRGEWGLATVEMYRSIARGLGERELVVTLPGTTAHEFGYRAAGPFPGDAGTLQAAATAFDEVRYLGGAGSREDYESVAALEARLRTARPLVAATADGGSR